MKFNLTRPEAGALLRDKLVLASAGSVLAALVVLGWLLFGDILSGDKKRTTYTHMHCPVCKEEHAFNAKLASKPCTNCETGSTLTPTVGSIVDGVPVSTGVKVIVYLLLAAFLVECAAYVAVRRLRALRAAEEEIRRSAIARRKPARGSSARVARPPFGCRRQRSWGNSRNVHDFTLFKMLKARPCSMNRRTISTRPAIFHF